MTPWRAGSAPIPSMAKVAMTYCTTTLRRMVRMEFKTFWTAGRAAMTELRAMTTASTWYRTASYYDQASTCYRASRDEVTADDWRLNSAAVKPAAFFVGRGAIWKRRGHK